MKLPKKADFRAERWVPEPTASQLIFEANAHIFLDERSQWPRGNFSTAELVVSTSFLNVYPDVVKKIIEADVYETLWINSNIDNATKLHDYDIATLASSSRSTSRSCIMP